MGRDQKDQQGNAIPYGTIIKDNAGNVLGIVGQGGRAMVDQPEKNEMQWLSLKWVAKKTPYSCHVKYIPEEEEAVEKNASITTINKICEKI